MNKTFRVIWNETRGLWLCVSELTRPHQKNTREKTSPRPVTEAAVRALSDRGSLKTLKKPIVASIASALLAIAGIATLVWAEPAAALYREMNENTGSDRDTVFWTTRPLTEVDTSALFEEGFRQWIAKQSAIVTVSCQVTLIVDHF